MDVPLSSGSVVFSLVDRELKLFKNALQSLHKIGPELMIEALPSRLDLRVISVSQSSYMSMSYLSNFFDAYDVFDCNVTQAVVLFKHILSVFRTQRVNKIVFELKTEDARVKATLHCDNGLLKSYKFPTMDGEVLQATVDRITFPVCVVAETGAMTKLLSTFHSSLSEVTITAQAEGGTAGGSVGKSIQLRSYLDHTKTALDQSLHTLLTFDAALTFVSYTHNCDEAVQATFNVKDFRAMLGLCDSLGSQIQLLFSGPGAPLVAAPHFAGGHNGEADYEAELIVATLTEGLEPMASQPIGEGYMTGNARERRNDGHAGRATPLHVRETFDVARGEQEQPRFSGLEDDPSHVQWADDALAADDDLHAASAELGLGGNNIVGGSAYEEDAVPSTPPEEQGPGATIPGVIAVSHGF